MNENGLQNANHSSLEESALNWKLRFSQLQHEYNTLLEENKTLKERLEICQSSSSKSSLPSKDEVESISAMLDLVNKLDEETINKIERLNKKKL